jgi:hypothetical protein
LIKLKNERVLPYFYKKKHIKSIFLSEVSKTEIFFLNNSTLAKEKKSEYSKVYLMSHLLMAPFALCLLNSATCLAKKESGATSAVRADESFSILLHTAPCQFKAALNLQEPLS